MKAKSFGWLWLYVRLSPSMIICRGNVIMIELSRKSRKVRHKKMVS